jgi:hypothetical protein
MAGAFGFERDHYGVSVAAGERALLPEVRRAPRDQLIVSDGFSCREQIAQLTDRRALHLAELLHLAGQTGPRGPAGDFPERAWVHDYAAESRPSTAAVAGLAGLAIAGVWGLGRAARRRQ